MAAQNRSRGTGWLMAGVLLAGVLLVVGAFTTSNPGMAVISVLIVFVAAGSVLREGRDRDGPR